MGNSTKAAELHVATAFTKCTFARYAVAVVVVAVAATFVSFSFQIVLNKTPESAREKFWFASVEWVCLLEINIYVQSVYVGNDDAADA